MMAAAALVFRFVLGTVFLLAGLAKLPRRGKFEQAVRGYELVPGRLARPVALVLPPVELAGGSLLVLGLGTGVVASCLAALLLVFAGAVSVNLLRGRSIDCGCFGSVAEKRITWLTVARNAVFIGVALLVAVASPPSLAIAQGIGGGGAASISSVDTVGFLIVGSVATFTLTITQEALLVRRLSAVGKETDQ